ncbi:diguanylate cyclase [Neptuniibacter sp.]|uniref:diguanylate cyclase n=1 Tax=Neptuniibacter sp. TaxID=1962643 RepID=UPI0026147189|nr:diguanylate cyclase [Neptuniibacter sp.]MCP4598393.1 diguanylate cyclase [Neptuniibacter sp.]
MGRIYCCTLLFLLALPSFVKAETTGDSVHNSLNVTAGVVSNFPPQYSLDENGRPQGFAIDSMNAISKIANVSVDYKVYGSWGDLSKALRTGEVNLIPNNGITGLRREYSDFSQPIETFAISVFVRKNSGSAKTLGDLKDTVIGVVERNAAIRFLHQRNYKTKTYPDFSNLLVELISGRIDAAAYPAPVVWLLAREAGLEHRISPIEPPLAEIKRGMAFPKGHTELLNRFDDAISQFIQSEDYKDIYGKWYAAPAPYWSSQRVIMLLSVVVVLLLVITFVWRNFSLRKINRQLRQETVIRSQAETKLKFLNAELEEKVELRTAELAKRNQILSTIDSLREDFIKETAALALFPELLESLKSLTDSEYGFIGEVQYDQTGSKYLKVYAISNLSWNEETNRLYESFFDNGIEFKKLDNLFGRAITHGNTVISNDPVNDDRSSGLPKGHPELTSFIGIPVFFGERLVGEIGLANRNGGYDESILNDLAPVVDALGQIIVGRWDRQARLEAEKELKELASTDPLTEVSNRRSFESKLIDEMARANRYEEPLSLLMLDIDHFKEVNDHYGHDAGDIILKELTNEIKDQVRKIDFIARWGGEEFMIILPKTPLEMAKAFAERLRKQIEAYAFSYHSETTISLGITSFHRGENKDDFVSRADQALYEAKESGRNRVAFRD